MRRLVVAALCVATHAEECGASIDDTGLIQKKSAHLKAMPLAPQWNLLSRPLPRPVSLLGNGTNGSNGSKGSHGSNGTAQPSCFEHDCDYWTASGYSCEVLQDYYQCDCTGSKCALDVPSCTLGTCNGHSCDYWVVLHGMRCSAEPLSSCNCEGCRCIHDEVEPTEKPPEGLSPRKILRDCRVNLQDMTGFLEELTVADLEDVKWFAESVVKVETELRDLWVFALRRWREDLLRLQSRELHQYLLNSQPEAVSRWLQLRDGATTSPTNGPGLGFSLHEVETLFAANTAEEINSYQQQMEPFLQALDVRRQLEFGGSNDQVKALLQQLSDLAVTRDIACLLIHEDSLGTACGFTKTAITASSPSPPMSSEVILEASKLIMTLLSHNLHLNCEHPKCTAMLCSFLETDYDPDAVEALVLPPLPRISSRDRASIASIGGRASLLVAAAGPQTISTWVENLVTTEYDLDRGDFVDKLIKYDEQRLRQTQEVSESLFSHGRTIPLLLGRLNLSSPLSNHERRTPLRTHLLKFLLNILSSSGDRGRRLFRSAKGMQVLSTVLRGDSWGEPLDEASNFEETAELPPSEWQGLYEAQDLRYYPCDFVDDKFYGPKDRVLAAAFLEYLCSEELWGEDRLMEELLASKGLLQVLCRVSSCQNLLRVILRHRRFGEALECSATTLAERFVEGQLRPLLSPSLPRLSVPFSFGGFSTPEHREALQAFHRAYMDAETKNSRMRILSFMYHHLQSAQGVDQEDVDELSRLLAAHLPPEVLPVAMAVFLAPCEESDAAARTECLYLLRLVQLYQLRGMVPKFVVELEVASKETQYANACSKWKAKETRKRHFDFMLLHRMPHLPEDPGDPGSEPQLADFQEKVVKKALEVSSQRLVRRRWDLRRRLGNMSQAQLKQLDHMTMPPLEIFAWKRLVVDELHEPLRALRDAARLRPDTSLKAAERILFHNFESLEAESRWRLTATPTISSAPEVSFLARFHRVFVPRDSDLEAQHYLDEYVRSNDLDVSTIPIEYHLIAVRHTGGERALYLNQNSREVKDREALLQICNFFSPDDRDDDMSSAINTTRCDNELELSRHRAEMEKTKGTIAELRKQEHENWRNAKNEEEIKKLKGKLRRLEATMPLMEQKDRRLESRKKYFEEVLKELKKLEQANVECPICMTDIETEECSVTACGHLFCQSCITGWLKDKGHKCPSCNHPLQLTGGVAAATEVLSRNQEVSSQARIARFGSKLEAVCNQLKNIWKNEEGAKVIIFVQFEVLRKKMEGALSSLGMSCLTLRCTVFERRRAIRQFHAPGQENQILLLSLERSPAGMNLVCCHHLILVHPMLAESRDAALSFERQAIGRVRRQGQKENVHVYRFYVRDTMEEEMVRAHHQKLLQGQVEREA